MHRGKRQPNVGPSLFPSLNYFGGLCPQKSKMIGKHFVAAIKDLLSKNKTETVLWVIFLGVYGWFASFGTFDFFENDAAGRGAAYDSMARNFLHFDVSVDPSIIDYEGYIVNGKTHMYFGPWPSFLRFIPNSLFPQLFGLWSRFSCFSAAVLSLFALTLIIKNSLNANSSVVESDRQFWRRSLTIAFATGSPLLFGVASSAIYHEAILWGLAGSLWALHFTLQIVAQFHSRKLWLASLSSAISFLSRATFGIPWCLVCLGMAVFKKKIFPSAELRLTFLVPILMAVAIQAGFNTARFGSPLTFQDPSKYSGFGDKVNDPNVVYGSFNLLRLPINFKAYFGWDSNNFSAKFPYVRVAKTKVSRPEIIGYFEPVLALTVGSLWLVIFALLGMRMILWPKYDWPRIALGGLLCSTLPAVLTIGFLSQRYTLEFIPVMTLLLTVVLQKSKLLSNKTFKFVLGSLIVSNIFITSFSTLAWTGEYWWATPEAHRRRVVEWINHVDLRIKTTLIKRQEQRQVGP
jgi:hypothetical protein